MIPTSPILPGGKAASAVAPRDPNYTSRVLGLHCDGANNSTTFTDVSSAPHTVTANGNAKVSTAQYKFGGASLALDGAGDYLSVPDSNDWTFGTGDFCIEFWAWVDSTTNSFTQIIGQRSSTLVGWALGIDKANNKLYFWQDASFILGSNGNFAGMYDAWHFITLARSGGTTRLFIDGAVVNSAASVTHNNNTGQLEIGGCSSESQYLKGYLDDLVIYKGVAVRAAAFSPLPEWAFANS